MYRILFREGPLKGRKLAVKKGSVVFGNGPGCHVCVEQDAPDGHLAVIEERANGLFIRVLQEQTPLLLGGIPRREAPLHSGDVVQLAASEFVFYRSLPAAREQPRRTSAIVTCTMVAVCIVLLLEVLFLLSFLYWRHGNPPEQLVAAQVAPSSEADHAAQPENTETQAAQDAE